MVTICRRYYYNYFYTVAYIAAKSHMHQHLSEFMFFKNDIPCMHVYGVDFYLAYNSACRAELAPVLLWYVTYCCSKNMKDYLAVVYTCAVYCIYRCSSAVQLFTLVYYKGRIQGDSFLAEPQYHSMRCWQVFKCISYGLNSIMFDREIPQGVNICKWAWGTSFGRWWALMGIVVHVVNM